MDNKKPTKGRGSQGFSSNKFDQNQRFEMDGLAQTEDSRVVKTECIPVHPKSIVNKVESPDIPFDYSLNPYQGCEHGCIYCYARNSHEFWGYNPGIDFESKILTKAQAPELLKKFLAAKSWKPQPIMLSGNTDCYQPVEKRLEITRELLKVFLDKRHPVALITKNKLILRDLDIIEKLAELKLVSVALSINYDQDEVRRLVEPRTSSVDARFETLRVLSQAGVHTSVLIAPVIPAINDEQVPRIIERAAELGAKDLHYIFVRLNGAIGLLFSEWLQTHFPDRADKVLNRIRDLHGGSLNDSRFGTRMRGEGHWADIFDQQFKLIKRKHLPNPQKMDWNLEAFDPQLKLY